MLILVVLNGIVFWIFLVGILVLLCNINGKFVDKLIFFIFLNFNFGLFLYGLWIEFNVGVNVLILVFLISFWYFLGLV